MVLQPPEETLWSCVDQCVIEFDSIQNCSIRQNLVSMENGDIVLRENGNTASLVVTSTKGKGKVIVPKRREEETVGRGAIAAISNMCVHIASVCVPVCIFYMEYYCLCV